MALCLGLAVLAWASGETEEAPVEEPVLVEEPAEEPAPTPTPAPTPELPETYVRGDFDGDGVLTLMDAVAILRYFAEGEGA